MLQSNRLFRALALFTLFILLTLAINVQASTKTEPSIFISTEWVNQHQEKLVLVDLSSQSSYQKFHLPNAIWVNYA